MVKIGQIVKIINDSRVGRVVKIIYPSAHSSTNLYKIEYLIKGHFFIFKHSRYCYFRMFTKPSNEEKMIFMTFEEQHNATKTAEEL